MPRPPRLLSVLMLSLGALLAAGCMPTSVTLNFGVPGATLKESVVATDGAGTGTPAAKVALIDVRGMIIDGPVPGLFTSGRNPVAELALRLRKAEEDPAVKAVVLRISSPGGGVGATETMYNEVRRFREATGKPVVVQLGDIAASGGYYLALAGDCIIASPSGITGSIGVIIPTFNFSEGMKKVGIVSRSIKSRENKDLANPFEPMRDSQYAVLQGLVDGMYATFRTRVWDRRGGLTSAPGAGGGAVGGPHEAACGALVRPVNVARFDELTDGRVMLGAAAVDAGLADATGDVYDAFAKARELAGVPGAALVLYYRGGEKPLTPLALSESPSPVPLVGSGTMQGAEINLLQVQLGAGTDPFNPHAMSTGGAYYLWWAGE